MDLNVVWAFLIGLPLGGSIVALLWMASDRRLGTKVDDLCQTVSCLIDTLSVDDVEEIEDDGESWKHT